MVMTVVNLRGSSKVGKGDYGVLLHFGLVALVALGLYFIIRKGMWRLRPLAVLLALVGIFCVCIPAMPENVIAAFSNGRPPVFSLCMSLFLPVSFYLFFRTVPDGREGFSFALVIVANEFLWSLFFPLLSGVATHTPNTLVVHVFILCCWLLGVGGFCLALSIFHITRKPDTTPGDISDTASGSEPFLRDKCIALCLISMTTIGTLGLVGLSTGIFLAKTAMIPEFSGTPHFFFIFLLPVIGWMLDTQPGKFIVLYIPGLVGVFCLRLAYTSGLISQMAFFYPLNTVQQSALLLLFAVTCRMLKTQPVFPLVLVLGYCLIFAQFGGMIIRGLVQDVPYGVTMVSLALIAGAALSLWRFRRLLAKKPELLVLPRTETVTAPVSESETEAELSLEARLAAIAAHYALSDRETQILHLLMQGVSDHDAAEMLEIKKATIRTTIHRMKEKTGAPSRDALVRLTGR
jgi:DNA-binding CsgD family transcriptional regulator